MSRTGLLAVLLLTALLFLGSSLLPDEQLSPPLDTPWNVTLTGNGNSQLLGITLDESTLHDAQSHWKKAAKITLFMPKTGEPKVEAYFERVTLGGIGASIVAELSMPETQLTQLIEQGARISTQGDGSRKITLNSEGASIAEQSVISSLTYLPKANLSPEVIKQRFGLPTQILLNPEEQIEHWIYPLIGLDIVVSEETKEVLQYVSPRNIERLLKPLSGLSAQPPA